MATSTGAPLNILIPARGETDWDDELDAALTAINSAVATINTSLTNKADLTSGKVPTSQLPSIAINNVFPAANQAAMLALAAAPGDQAVRSDNGHIYVLTGTPASTLGNWTQIDTGGGVTSWNGQGGIITGKPEYSTTGTWALKQTFTVSPSIPTASVSDAPVTKAQLDTAISGVTASAIPGRYSATLGNGSATSFTQTHGRGTADVTWACYDLGAGSPYPFRWPDEVKVTSTQITLYFVTAPATNSIRLVVM
jgi:hypothetical protein